MARPTPPREQQAAAQRRYDLLRRVTAAELRDLAELLAGKADGALFGTTEFQGRDAVHRRGAKALKPALQGRTLPPPRAVHEREGPVGSLLGKRRRRKNHRHERRSPTLVGFRVAA